MNEKKFNIRVYGIWINEHNQVLLSDERYDDITFTKFPGGGLEFGESTIECLKREWVEELNTIIEVKEHFYTTDFFQPSAFHKDTQIISIYYFVTPLYIPEIIYKTKKHDFELKGSIEVHFRWQYLNELTINDLDLPIDKKVVKLLLEHFQ
jgi:8-oxo-dGTP pyrophosphatase MutT (NUDIX family)